MTSFRSLAAALGLAFLAATAAIAQTAPACSLLIDASASMEGYRHADRAPLMALIERLRQRCPATSEFGDSLRTLPAGQPVVFNDQRTNIGPAVEQWAEQAPDGSYVVIVTDNVSDTSDKAGDPTAKFYSLLRSEGSPFSHIVVMALREAFDGKVYDPRDSRLQQTYRGPRALTLYILAKRADGHDGEFAALRRSIAAILDTRHHASGDDDASYTVFDVKPFATEEFRINSTAAEVRSDTTAATVKCSDKARFDPTTNTFLMPDQPMDRDCVLAADLLVRFADRWCLKDTDLTARADIRNEDRAIFKPAVTTDVTPSRASLCADNKKLTVTFRFSAYRFAENVGFFDKLARTFTGTFQANGALDVYGTVTRQNVTLNQDTNSAWSMGSEDDISVAGRAEARYQRRVFRLEEGVRAVIPEAELHNHQLAHYNIKATVRYEQWPIVVLIVIVLALIALAAGLFFLGRKPVVFAVETDDGGEQRLYLSAFGAERVESRGIVLTLRNAVFFLLAGATGTILRGRLLPPGGGTILVLPPGTSKGRTRPVHRKRRADADDDFADDASFDNPSPSDTTAEPVRFTVRAERHPGPHEEHDDETF
jgi:hypothetical protein